MADVICRRSIRNRARLEAGVSCGCFHCRSRFPAVRIVEWVDDDRTALCPVCAVDAVLAEPEDDIGLTFLRRMRERYFGPMTADEEAAYREAQVERT